MRPTQQPKKKLKTLTRKKDFRDLIKQGQRLKPTAWMLVNYDRNGLGYLRLGFTASRKVGTAVVRNRLRRWCKEFFRKQEEEISLDLNLLFLDSKKQNFYKDLKHEQLEEVLSHVYSKVCRRN